MTRNPNPDQDRLTFELSGEHDRLPKAEVLACLEAEGAKYRIEEEDQGVLVVDVEGVSIEDIKERLALTHYINRTIVSCDAKDVATFNRSIGIGEGTSPETDKGSRFPV